MYLVKFDVTGLSELNASIERVKRIPADKLKKVLNWWRFTLANNVNRSLSSGPLSKRTGKLMKSVDPHQNLTVVQKDDNTFYVQIAKDVVVYAYSHETGAAASGGVIRPVNKQWLAVPIRSWRGNQAPIPLSRYAKKNKVILRSKLNPEELIVFWKRSKTEMVPIAVLKKSIKVKKRPWFQEAVKRSLPNLMSQVSKA